MKKEEKGQSVAWRDFIDLVKQTKPSKWMIMIAIVMSLMTTAVGLMIPLFTRNLVDHFSMESLEVSTIILLVAAFIMQAVAGGLSIYLLNHVGQKVVARLRNRLWNKFLKLPIPFYDKNQSGEMISRMTNDTAVIRGLITDHLTSFFTGIISIIGSVVILLVLDWKMTIIMLIAAPLTLAILFPLGGQMHKISKGLQDETARFTALISQVLSEIRLVKSSNAETAEFQSGNKGINKLFRFGVREGKIQALISPLVSFVLMLLLVVIIGYGGMRVSSGALSAGDLVAFILYLFQIVFPMAQFATFFTQLQKAKGATERIINTLGENEEDLQSGKEVADFARPIIFDQVSFSYEKSEPILKKVTFQANHGKVTAIVGPSGAGKTTLFSLMQRYYHPTEGTIRLGEEPIEDFTLYSWRSQIGYVSQESPIVAGTIRENITYGLEEVNEHEMIEAAKMAYADQFISEFSDQYDTEVGERGIKLSGGQRQRIAIARALLRNPKV
ncbi:MAG TPA: ABC transporter ATP-binding protein, partial [Candidatus Avamphibacillus sp.]|nr:ABC transporter ATP-binding protein [Candidatus Avamphibacillus sp.]